MAAMMTAGRVAVEMISIPRRKLVCQHHCPQLYHQVPSRCKAHLMRPAAASEPDDKHKGKIRSFPHVEGNYPSHVYIPVVVRYQSIGFNLYRKAPKSHSLHTLVDRLLATQSVKLEPYEGDMHVSLSRPFALRQMQITPFADSLRRLCVLPRYENVPSSACSRSKTPHRTHSLALLCER